MRECFPDRSFLWMLMGEVYFVSARVSQKGLGPWWLYWMYALDYPWYQLNPGRTWQLKLVWQGFLFVGFCFGFFFSFDF